MKTYSIWRKPFYYLLLIGSSLLITEVILRLCDIRPFVVQAYQINSDPSFCLLPDDYKGFALQPGQFDVMINEKVHYRVTHGRDSLRITRPDNLIVDENKRRVDLHGCSFIYGMGVSDRLSYPYLLQDAMPEYQIRNFGVPGFGTLQALLILKEQIAANQKPDVLVVHFASFHDDRNGLSSKYRMALYHGFSQAHKDIQPTFSKSRIPYLSDVAEVKYQNWENIYRPWWGRSFSALINSLQTSWEYLSYSPEQLEISTQSILKELIKLCKSHQIELVVCIITADQRSQKMKNFCQESGLLVWDIGLELPSEQWSKLPYDIHPNEKAHLHFANKMKVLFQGFEHRLKGE